MNLAEVIKKCSMEAFEASIPCDIVFGTVVGIEPCLVKVGDMTIPSEILSVAEHLLHKETTVTLAGYEKTVVINAGLSLGDTLVLLRQAGGGNYVAIGKM
ncbi:MAG: DUF2577 family protein [Clostridia bacterium]|nr:DUF2577 family protein [Clostridia bacterium]